MNYLKLFQNHSEYEDFVSGGTMIIPNVSHCISEDEVHYNPIIIIMTVRYNVTNARIPTQLYTYTQQEGIIGAAMFDKVEVEKVSKTQEDDLYIEVPIADLDASGGTWHFAINGEYTVKYTLKDPTLIGAEFDEQRQTVTRLGATFMGCSSVISVNIPNSVTSIGYGAFRGCIGLTGVTMSDCVTSIGDYAFSGCTGLASVTIPDSVTSIGESAFYDCTSLASVTIPDSVTSIGDEAFCNVDLLDAPTQTKIMAINPNAICGIK